MTKLISPAPNGAPGLAFGATAPKPYSKARPHKGRDWKWYYANPTVSRRVVAPVSGTVESVYSGGGFNEGWGNRVIIRVNSRVTSTLNHLLTGSIKVRKGQYVNAGTYVGQMGATGEAYGQVHLHEELYVDGTRVNPDYYRSHDLPGTETPSGGGATPFPTNEMDEDMAVLVRRESNNAAYIIVPGRYIKHVPDANEERLIKYSLNGGSFQALSDADLSVMMWAFGFPELEGRVSNMPLGGNFYWSSR